MRNIIVIGFLILLITGCGTSKSTTSSTTRSDSVSEKKITQYQDTVYQYLFIGSDQEDRSGITLGDTLNKLNSLIRYLQSRQNISGNDITVLTQLLNTPESYLSSPFAESWAQVIDGMLKHRLHAKDTTISIRLKNAIRLTDYFYYRYKQLITEKETIKTSFWAEAWIWIRGILVGIGLSFLIWLILKLKSYIL